jgi:hypothetical protein
MNGHHEVKVVAMPLRGDAFMPSNWKPFAAFHNNGVTYLVCRKWVRDEKTTKEEPST